MFFFLEMVLKVKYSVFCTKRRSIIFWDLPWDHGLAVTTQYSYTNCWTSGSEILFTSSHKLLKYKRAHVFHSHLNTQPNFYHLLSVIWQRTNANRQAKSPFFLVLKTRCFSRLLLIFPGPWSSTSWPGNTSKGFMCNAARASIIRRDTFRCCRMRCFRLQMFD